ncbi:histone-lysine N-methyltransferase 2D-like [Sinocyclocheilus anshuiensis]|uniref:histone-lysine N-methyltransferase 2D-like n=1 Tax=Sinocyclocheilus anshuiensis TaxID=1608454 RepID=UPI0007B96A13|nr:PREDICTED: histone-lysine N-methyltransferase 2D-like [Sinocyclocheilus anshuiensis]
MEQAALMDCFVVFKKGNNYYCSKAHHAQMEREPVVTKALEYVAQIIAPELKPKNESDQVCEPATTLVPVRILVEYEGKEEGPAHIPAAEAAAYVTPVQPQEPSALLWPVILLALLDFLTSSVQPESCTCLPPHLTPFKHSSPAPLLSVTTYAQPSASSHLSTGSSTPPWSFDPQTLPRLLAPSSPPWPVIPSSPLGSLIPPAPPWLHFRPLAPPWSSRSLPPPRSPESAASPWPSRSSRSPRLCDCLALFGSPSMSQELTPLDTLPRSLREPSCFVELVLVNNDSPLTVFNANEELTSPTLKPEPSQPSPSETELMPGAGACRDQSTGVLRILVEYEGKEEGPAHIPAAEAAAYVTPVQPQEPSPLLWPVILLALLDFLTSSVQPESCTCLPPHLTPFKHSSPAPLLSVTTYAQPSASSHLSTGSCTPPWSFDPQTLPRLLAPSSPPWPVIPSSPLGSLIPPAPPWLHFRPLAPPWSSRSLPPPRSPESAASPWPSRSSRSPRLCDCLALFGSPSMSQELTPLDTLPSLSPAPACHHISLRSSTLPQLHCCPSPPMHNPQPVLTYVGLHRGFLPSALTWREVPLSLPPATGSSTPPWSFDPQTLPRLLAPSSPPWPVIPSSPLGSLILPAPPWLHFRPLAPPWSSRSLPPPRSPESAASPWPSRSSRSPRLCDCLALFGSPSMPASSQELTPLDTLPRFPPWLLPPATPPWAFVLPRLWWFTSCLLRLWPAIHLNTLLAPRFPGPACSILHPFAVSYLFLPDLIFPVVSSH